MYGVLMIWFFHKNPKVVISFIKQLNNVYKKEACRNEVPLTIHWGRVHKYLGMTLDYTSKGKVRIDMQDYVKKLLEELPKSFEGAAVTPTANHLFQVSNDCKKLASKDAELFHHVVAQLLFLCNQSCPDLQTSVTFLSTRFKDLDDNDMKKIKRTILYLRGSLNLL